MNTDHVGAYFGTATDWYAPARIQKRDTFAVSYHQLRLVCTGVKTGDWVSQFVALNDFLCSCVPHPADMRERREVPTLSRNTSLCNMRYLHCIDLNCKVRAYTVSYIPAYSICDEGYQCTA